MEMKSSVFDFEGASLSQLAFSTCWLGKDVLAVVAGYYSLGMAENHSSLVAATTLDVHKIRVGSRYETFEFVGLSFCFENGVQ
jgi:hypothetical protein